MKRWRSLGCFLVILTILQSALTLTSQCFAESEESSVREIWDAQLRVLQDTRAGINPADSARNMVSEFLIDNGVTRSPLMAAAYCSQGVKLMEQQRYAMATWAFNSALSMDPGYRPAAQGLIVAAYKQGISHFIFAIPGVITTYMNGLRDPWLRLLLTSRLGVELILGGFIFALIVTLSLMIRTAPLIELELRVRLLEGIAEKFSWPATFLVLFCPLFFGLGVVWGMIWWAILAYMYLHKRMITVIWVALFAGILVIPGQIFRAAGFQAYETPVLYAMASAQYGGYSSNLIETLKKYPSRIDPSRSNFLKGMLYKRGGRYFEALREYLEYTRINPQDAAGHVNLGNIYFILNNLGEAVSEYRQAKNYDHRNPAIFYNLSKAYLHQFKFQQASDMIKQAGDIDPEFVAFYTEIHSSHPNRMLVDSSFDSHWLDEEFYAVLTSAVANMEKYWISPGFALDFSGYAVTIGALIVLFMILNISKAKFQLARFCLMCGQPHVATKAGNTAQKYCEHCEVGFLKKGPVDSALRERKIRDLEEQMRVQRITHHIMNLLFPGSGDLYRGKILRGAIISILWSGLLAGLLAPESGVVAPWNTTTVGASLPQIILVVSMSVLYLFNLLLTFSGGGE